MKTLPTSSPPCGTAPSHGVGARRSPLDTRHSTLDADLRSPRVSRITRAGNSDVAGDADDDEDDDDDDEEEDDDDDEGS